MRHNYLLVITSFFLISCGSQKKMAGRISNQQKLEIEFRKYKGIPYKFGGMDKRGFDCSGFVNRVFKDALNVQLPRQTKNMKSVGKKVRLNQLKPGDLLFFKPTKKYDHVGIYIGDQYFIHSASSSGVTKSSLNNPYWKKYYTFAKRILKP